MPKIRVHERALAHLSRGLYRSPASAIRELVSNSWDANATSVYIDTNYPKFHHLSIEDNGDGFGRDEFERLMKGGIGNSEKRVEPHPLKFGRPTIGRLGIGMLGIAQICGAFTITSRPLTGKGFSARVRLYDLVKKKMDEADSEFVEAANTVVDDETLSGSIYNVGTYEFMDVGREMLPHGTRIFADDVNPVFTKAFQDSLNLEFYKPVPIDWRAATTKVLNKASSLQLLGDYWRLLWELSVACPVPYLSNDALPKGVARNLNEELESFKFKVVVDGRNLFKPIYLRGNEGGYTARVIQNQKIKVYGREIEFGGYVVVQEGKQLKPDELRGIMVRIKNVGIGYYDQSMLDYRSNEGPRSRWVTGELFVRQGLEDALNVDRDSFNRFHPEFRALQQFLHSFLQKEIFPEVYRNIEVRSKERKKDIASKRSRAVTAVVKQEGLSITVTKRAMDAEESSTEPLSSASEKRNEIEINVPRAEDIPTSKTHQQLAQAILTIFERALLETGKAAQRRKFSELLISLLKRW